MQLYMMGAARRIQALIFLLSHRLDASRHFSENFLVIPNHIRLFFDAKVLLQIPKTTYRSFPNLQFFSHQIFFTRTRILVANALCHQCLQRKRAQTLFNLPLHKAATINRNFGLIRFSSFGSIHDPPLKNFRFFTINNYQQYYYYYHE